MAAFTQTHEDEVIALLIQKHYILDVKHTDIGNYKVIINIGRDAAEVFIKHLDFSGGIIDTFKQDFQDNTVLGIYLKGTNPDTIRNNFDYAYNKVLQYLDYQDLRREYAAGYVPAHLSEWLIDGWNYLKLTIARFDN